MGSSHSNERRTLTLPDLFCPVCYVKDDLRAIDCGHFFCLACSLILKERNGGTIVCPFDKKQSKVDPELGNNIDEKSMEKLDLAIFMELRRYSKSRRREPNSKSNLSASLACRWMTVATLRDIATLLDSIELRGSKVQVGSLSACIAGGLAVTAGLGLTLSGVAAPVGIPLLVGGAAVGGGGAIGSLAANVIEMLSRKTNVQRVNMILQIDNFLSEQMLIMAQRAQNDVKLADSWDMHFFNGFGFALIFPNVAKVGAAGMAGAKTAAMAGTRMATLSIYHGVGLFLAAVMIPVDIAQLISVSIKLHKEDPSSLVKEIRNLADKLEVQLKMFYLQFGFFQLIQCHRIPNSHNIGNCNISAETNSNNGLHFNSNRNTNPSAIFCEHDNEKLAINQSGGEDIINLNVSSDPFSDSTCNDSYNQKMESSANMDDNFLIVSEADEVKIGTSVFERSNSADPDAASNGATPMWVYACIDPLHAEELELYQDIGRDSSGMLTYEEVQSWGKIILEGEGTEPPSDVKTVVEDEWFSLIYPEIEFVDISHSTEEEAASPRCIVSTHVMDFTFDAKGDTDIGGGSFGLR